MYQKFFDIYDNIEIPQYNIQKYVDLELIDKIENTINDKIQNTILFVPTARSIQMLSEHFWNRLYNEIKNQYPSIKIISDTRINQTIPFFNITMCQLIGLCVSVKSVYALRSGLCDIIHVIGNKLNVIYSDNGLLYSYSINKLFNRNDVNEIII